MTGLATVTGMILSAQPIGEYDRRLVILTRERGLISAFARGARKPNSPLVAAASTFAFGSFDVFEGRTSYSVNKAEISNFFREISENIEYMFYASYFAEMAEYYAVENADEKDRLKLIYQSFRALESGKFSLRLIRTIYEYKTMVINGVYPDTSKDEISKSAHYALDFIMRTPVEKLYTFTLTPEVEEEVFELVSKYRRRFEEHVFKTEAFIETL